MPTSLPAITPRPGSAGTKGEAPAQPPADIALFNQEKLIHDDRLGHSGFHAQGAVRRSTVLSPMPSGGLGGGLRALGGDAAGSSGTPDAIASPTSRYGPSFSKLAPPMNTLEETLRSLLQEQQMRNDSALQAIRQAAGISAPGPTGRPGTAGGAPAGTSPFGAAGQPRSQGALAHATAAGPAALSGPSLLSATPSPSPGTAPGALFTGRPVSAGAGGAGARALSVLGPRWGSAEGGRDSLGWVRSLVTYTEAHPIAVGLAAGGQAAQERGGEVRLDPAGSSAGGAAFRRGVFPSPKPDRREDALLLGRWLEDMVKQLSSHDAARIAAQLSGSSASALVGPTGPGAGAGAGTQAPGGSTSAGGVEPSTTAAAMAAVAAALPPPADSETSTGGANAAGGGAGVAGAGPGPTSVAELVDGVIHVYGVALEELRRQVSTECKERGDLLAAITDHLCSALALRVGLEYEGRMGRVQAECGALLEARDVLRQDVVALEGALVGADVEARRAAAQAATSSRSLAGKLAAAQAQAEEVAGAWRVADLALSNEAARRLEAEGELASTRILLQRTEHEWLAHRARVSALEEELAALREELARSRAEVAAGEAARDAGRREFEDLAASKAAQEVELVRMRHEYETDEILVVSLKQQVRDLEAQLAQLKAFQRDQALKLGDVVEEKEALEALRDELTAQLNESRAQCEELESKLAITEADLSATKQELALRMEEAAAKQAELEEELAQARKEVQGLQTEVQQLTNSVGDTKHELELKTLALAALENEIAAVKELLVGVCGTLDQQEADGVIPKADDKGWTVPGPLGAVQRSLVAASRQLAGLWERLEQARREVQVLTERLDAEMAMQAQLREELHQAKLAEARMQRDKETASGQLEAIAMALRGMENERERLTQALKDALDRLEREEALTGRMRVELARLQPFEIQAKELEETVEDLRDRLRMSQAALQAAKDDCTSLTQQLEGYRTEMDRLLAQNGELVERVRQLGIVEIEVEELRATRTGLATELTNLQDRLDQAIAAHARTLHQLEIAKFFLQGLDLVPPFSPSMSPSPSRPQTATGAHQPAQQGEGDGPRVLWRPGTAPPNLPANARPGSAMPGGSEADDYLNVGPMELDGGGGPESGTASPAHRPSVPPALSGVMMRELQYQGGIGTSSVGIGTGGGPSLFSMAMGLGAWSRMGGAPRPGTADSGGSRPLSAVSQVSGASEFYDEDMPPEVVGMLEARGLSNKLQASGVKWLKFKVQVLAHFSNKLRGALLQEREKNARLEVELVRQQALALNDAVEREKLLSTEMVSNLRGQLERARTEALGELTSLKESLPGIRKVLLHLASTSTVMGMSLADLKSRLSQRAQAETQTQEVLDVRWGTFLKSLPLEPPPQPLSEGALQEAIVRIYVRAMGTVPLGAQDPVWGVPRLDTVYDAIMGHYTSQRAPGLFLAEYVTDVDGPIGRLLRCVRLNKGGSTRVAMFGCLTGMAQDGTAWPPATWHFLLHVLHALYTLLSGTWKTTLRAWMQGGALLPIQAVYDLVGNLFNLQVPTDLSGPVAQRLAALITPGTSGPVVDLDALLLLLVAEHNSGACPRAPLLHPRRLTDGALFNIFNVTGATNPNAVSALSDGRAINYLSTSPPGSPPRSTTYRTAATMVATGAFNPAARSLQGMVSATELAKGNSWQKLDGKGNLEEAPFHVVRQAMEQAAARTQQVLARAQVQQGVGQQQGPQQGPHSSGHLGAPGRRPETAGAGLKAASRPGTTMGGPKAGAGKW